MRFTYAHLVATLLALSSAPYAYAARATTRNGTYEGINVSAFNKDHYIAVRYAQAPTRALLYRPPQAINQTW